MRIEVIGKSNLTVTEAIRGYAANKAEKLPKFFDGVQLVTFLLSKADHAHTPQFTVELVVDVEKHADIVANVVGRGSVCGDRSGRAEGHPAVDGTQRAAQGPLKREARRA
jgi:hypothetical protein